MLEGQSRIVRMGSAFTMSVIVPAHLVRDSTFPFDRKGEKIAIRIEGGRLVAEKLKKGDAIRNTR